MKKRALKFALGVLALGSALGFASDFYSRKKAIAEVESRQIYIDTPVFISKSVEKYLDSAVKKAVNHDMAGVRHPQASRVTYSPKLDDGEFRITSYLDTELLRNNLGRTPSGGISAIEKKIGEDLWKFERLEVGGADATPDMINQAKLNVPWIFAASEKKQPYTVQALRDKQGRVKKLVYKLADRKTITLEDTNNNSIADKITEK